MTATTYTHCMRIERTDGEVIGLTDLDVDVIYDSVTYKAANAFSASNIDKTTTLSVNNGTINGLIVTDLPAFDLRNGFFDKADVYIFLYDFTNNTKVRDLARGFLGEVQLTRQGYTVEYRSLEQVMQQVIGKKYLATCPHKLGSTECGVSLASYTVTGTLTSVTDSSNFTDSSRAEADDYFNYGLLTFTSGDNDTLSREVKIFGSGAFEMLFPFPYTPQVGDTYSVYAGCNKTKATCRDKFDNVVNATAGGFGGYDFIPGQDELNKFGGQ